MKTRDHIRRIHWTYAIIYLVTMGVHGYIFVAKHIPAVGLERVLDNWVLYVMFWLAGTCLILLFYFFTIFITLVLSVGEE